MKFRITSGSGGYLLKRKKKIISVSLELQASYVYSSRTYLTNIFPEWQNQYLLFKAHEFYVVQTLNILDNKFFWDSMG